MNAQIQSVATKLINKKINGITNDNATKKNSFEANEANAET